jgi:putative variant cofactor biosynthesis B12-binding/radical SAM domain protein 1
MKILMIQAPSVEGGSGEVVYPIGIVLLASRLKERGHEVRILDMNLEADRFGALKDRLLDFQPDIACVSLRNIDPLANKTASLIPPFFVTVKMIASLLPNTWIIAGGTGFSLFPGRIMSELPQIHYGIIGEAEESLLLLISDIQDHRIADRYCFRKNDDLFDMKKYIPADRSLLDPALYSGVNSYVPAVGIETKRGCPFECAYCVYPNLQGRALRCREPKAVADEIETLHKNYGNVFMWHGINE